jgi:hypothetical protein
LYERKDEPPSDPEFVTRSRKGLDEMPWPEKSTFAQANALIENNSFAKELITDGKHPSVQDYH